MAEKRPDLVCVGAVAGAHGVRGLVRIKSFTARPDDIFAYGALTDEAGTRRFKASSAGHSKGQLLARIAGLADRSAAEAMKGTRLYVARSALPESVEDEFYHADLEGLVVERITGERFGTVTAVFDFGAGPILEIAQEDGASTMIPFTKAAFPVVDIGAGRIAVDPPWEHDPEPESDGSE